jgi:deoxyribodipyrimidine photolyase
VTLADPLFPNQIRLPAPAARGGRRAAAQQRLAAIDPARYGASRNHLDGAVTRLSPYIRHGVLSLAEVRDAVFERLCRGAAARPLCRVNCSPGTSLP